MLLEPEPVLHDAVSPREHLHNAKHLLSLFFAHTLQIPLALSPLTHRLAKGDLVHRLNQAAPYFQQNLLPRRSPSYSYGPGAERHTLPG